MGRHIPFRRKLSRATLAATLAGAIAAFGCGVPERTASDEAAAQEAAATKAAADYQWPTEDAITAVVRIKNMGEVKIELYPQLAPKTVANFVKLAEEDFYVRTTFHRVIPGFMIQGGSSASRDKDPYNDAHGGPGYTIEDEFNDAPHVRGAVSMANLGRKNTGGSQFFITHADRPDLDGRYTLFGRVVEGMDVVDAITQVEIDRAGRWGSPDRPIEKVAIEKVWIEAASHAASDEKAEPDGGAAPGSDA